MSFSHQDMFGLAMSYGFEDDPFRNRGPSEPQHAPQTDPTMHTWMAGYQTVSRFNNSFGLEAMYYGNPLAISSSSVGEPFPATLPFAFGDGYSFGTQGMYMGGFGSSYPQNPFSAATHPYIDPFPAIGSSELSLSLPPNSCRNISPILSPVDEYAPDPQLLIPQPSLAGPAYANDIHQPVDMCIEYSFDLLNIGAEPSMLGQHVPASNIEAPTCTNMDVPPPASPPLPPSSLPPLPAPLPAPRKKAQGTQKKAEQTRKTRSSSSKKSKSTKPTKASAPTSKVPCTEPGCEVLCFDVKTRDRHARSHNQTADEYYYCPGRFFSRDEEQKPCYRGYTREDALLRHLRLAEPDSPCVLEAKFFGWDGGVKATVQKLRGKVSPPL